MKNKRNVSARNEKINARLTKEELEMLKEKADKYFHGNKTRFIVESVRSYDDDNKYRKYMNIEIYSKKFDTIAIELTREGNNLNQFVHQLNVMMKTSSNQPEFVAVKQFLEESVMPVLNSHEKTISKFNKSISRILSQMIQTNKKGKKDLEKSKQ